MLEGRDVEQLLDRVRACTICDLEHGPRPVLQIAAGARILIAGQAPGRRVHESGVPFDDASGERLLTWTGLSRTTLRDPERVAILPMAFCYPGRGGSGDLPPRPECAATWRRQLLERLGGLRLTLLLGAHAIAWHLPEAKGGMTAAVRDWASHAPEIVPLPHPSPRNTPWLKRHPWFEREVLPELRRLVRGALA